MDRRFLMMVHLAYNLYAHHLDWQGKPCGGPTKYLEFIESYGVRLTAEEKESFLAQVYQYA